MNARPWLLSVATLLITVLSCQAHPIRNLYLLKCANRHLHGYVVDHTHNHGADRRIWSEALHEKRDMYVYLPPCYDPCKQYPVMIWLHGFAQDEHSFLEGVVRHIDKAIYNGELPPMIVAAPDGSIDGDGCLISKGSFYINTKAGNFEDYVICDVWPFLLANYPILPQRDFHILAGASMGGGGAYNLAIKHRDQFKIVIGIYPPLNTRWVDCHGQYRSHFDPDCWGWRTDVHRGHEVVARFGGVIAVRLKDLIDPIVNRKDPEEALEDISRENPIEMIDRLDLQEGELSMYVGYGGKDQFHIDAQVESFLYRAREKGLCIHVDYIPNGRHDAHTAYKLLPDIAQWLRPQLPDVR